MSVNNSKISFLNLSIGRLPAVVITLGALCCNVKPTTANADQLTFTGITSGASVLNYYNGGTDSVGESGPNYGVSFSQNAVAEPYASPSGSIVYFSTGNSASANIANGFTGSLGFDYLANSLVSAPYFVDIYSGLNGTGSMLASLSLVDNYPSANFTPESLAFSGVARSFTFGSAPENIVLDDVTFTPSTAPAPEMSTWASSGILTGFLAATVLRSRRRQPQT